MKNLTAMTKNVFFAALVSTATFSANATTGVEIVSDNYLYESLIQTEFDIDTQTENAIITSTSGLDVTVVTEMAITDSNLKQSIVEIAE